MIRLILLGLVLIAVGVIAPLAGTARVGLTSPSSKPSWLLAKPIIPELPEETGSNHENREQQQRQRDRENNDDWYEERRQDYEEHRQDFERRWDDEEARNSFEDLFN
jgi:hypothetical protein